MIDFYFYNKIKLLFFFICQKIILLSIPNYFLFIQELKVISQAKQKMKQNQTKSTAQFKKRSQSTILSNKKLNSLSIKNPVSKKHCQDDIACFHCCQCWIIHKAQYEKRTKIFEDKILQLRRQNDLLKKCIEKLTKENHQLKRQVKNVTDIQTIKQNVYQQLQKEINDEIRLNDLIQKQKIKNLTEKLENINVQIESLHIEKQKMEQQIKKYFSKIQQIQEQLNKLTHMFQDEKRLRQKTQKINVELYNQNTSLSQRIKTLQLALNEKTQNIDKMKSTLNSSQKYLSEHKQKISEKQFQMGKLNIQSQSKSQIIQNMTKSNIQKVQNIHLLKQQKGKLNMLVNCLNEQLEVNDKHQTVLKLALDQAEYIARQKSYSLESLKYDVSLLKYTL